MSEKLALHTFGGWRIERDGETVTAVGSRKVEALFVYLAVTARPHPRELLAELLWDDRSQKVAMSNLRRVLTGLRQHFGDYVTITRETAVLQPSSDLWLDAHELQTKLAPLTKSGQPLTAEIVAAAEAALTWYQGEFLAGFTVREASGFEGWLTAEREHWQQQVLLALTSLASYYEAAQLFPQGIAAAQRALQIDALQETAHQQLMRLLTLNGRRSDALTQYETCRQLLWDELEVTPAQETEALYRAIMAGELTAVPAQPLLTEAGEKGGRLVPSVDSGHAMSEAEGGAEERRAKGKEREDCPKIHIPHPASPPRHNLPPQSTPFIGREAELATLDDLIARSESRLITIVGPGGIGKTRLALALAEGQLKTDRFPNGVYFINLAPLSSPIHVIPTMAEALKFPLDTGEQQTRTPKQQILDYLRRKQMLLVLDNFEHLLSPPSASPGERILEDRISGAEELVIDILQTAPGVHILVTSRERLQLQGEQVFPLRGLTFPEVETVKPAVEYDAVKLFVQSARRVQPDFELGTDDVTDLTRVCRLVEGLPLAIELAASWVDILSLAGIAGEIQKSLDLLETDVRNVPERQRSIRAVFDASWQRMVAAEQEIFPQLSVFRGGFTRRAVQEVTGAPLRLLGSLSSKSMLQYNKNRDRYQIHELLRQYGAEKLSAAPQEELDARDRHSAYYCAALRRREDDLKGARQQAALREIEADSENVRAAWHWAIEREHRAQLALAMNTLGTFYEWQGRFRDGAAAFQALLASPLALSAPDKLLFWVRAMAWASVFQRTVERTAVAQETLSQARQLLERQESSPDGRTEQAFWHYQMGNLALTRENTAAQAAFLTSLGFYRQLEDQWGMARALHGLGEALYWLGDYAAAGTHLAESLAIYRALGDLRGVAAVTLTASMTARYQGRLEASLRLGEECLEISQKIGNRSLIAEAMSDLAVCHGRCFGRYAQAYELQNQGLAIAADLGNPWQLGNAYYRRGELAAHLGNFEAAEADLRQVVAVDRESGYRLNMAYALAALGQLLMAVGQPAEGRRVLSQALSICQELGHPDGTLMCTIYLTLLEKNSSGRWQAEQELFDILKASYERRAWVPYELLLPAIAALLAEPQEMSGGEPDTGRLLLAIEIAGLVDRGSRLRRRLVFDHLNELAANLPQDAVAAAKERSRQLGWWPMAEHLLEELPRLGFGG